MTTTDKDRDFEDINAKLRFNGRFDPRLLQNKDDVGDGFPGLQKAIRNWVQYYLHEAQMEQDLDLNAKNITNLADGVDSQDAQAFGQKTVASELNLNDLAEKSYNSLTDKPDVTPAITDTLIYDYVGDNAANRVIDLGDDYYEIHIYTLDVFAHTTDHFCEAYAFGTDCYGIFSNKSTPAAYHNANTGNYFQGKMSGGDINKIKLGILGSDDAGTNRGSVNYRIIAKKWA